MSKTVAFTGNRKIPKDKGLMWRLHEAIESLINKGYVEFRSGLALGADTWFTLSVMKHKEKHPNIKLVGFIPCLNQDKLWNSEQKEQYQKLLDGCDEVIQVSDLDYAPYLMMKRNERMIIDANYVLSIYDYSGKGGTLHALNFAEKLEKEIYIIKP